MGSLPQDNTPGDNWTDFFMQRRLEPQLRKAYNSGLLNKTAQEHFQRLYRHLPDFCPPEPPALFGSFDQKFYESYDHHYPLPPNYRQQWEIANLYPLLIHLNLFGVPYLPNILQIIQRF